MIADLGQQYCVSHNQGNRSQDYKVFADYKSFALAAAATLIGGVIAGAMQEKGQENMVAVGIAAGISTFLYSTASQSLNEATNRKTSEKIEADKQTAVDDGIANAINQARLFQQGIGSGNAVSRYVVEVEKDIRAEFEANLGNKDLEITSLKTEKDQLESEVKKLRSQIHSQEESTKEAKSDEYDGKEIFGDHSKRVVVGQRSASPKYTQNNKGAEL